jgi:hypothetical protein
VQSRGRDDTIYLEDFAEIFDKQREGAKSDHD